MLIIFTCYVAVCFFTGGRGRAALSPTVTATNILLDALLSATAVLLLLIVLAPVLLLLVHSYYIYGFLYSLNAVFTT
jgi:hypothetical protein